MFLIYYVLYWCTVGVLSTADALTNAAGIASGNAAVGVPIMMFMMLPLLYLWLQMSGHAQPRPEYEKKEKEDALNLLAIQLLRIRDSRVRGMPKSGILVGFGEELIRAAQHADGMFVDSDDSDSDEDLPPNKSSSISNCCGKEKILSKKCSTRDE